MQYTIKLADKAGLESSTSMTASDVRKALAIAHGLSFRYPVVQVLDENGQRVRLPGPAWEEEFALADITLRKLRKHGKKTHVWRKW